MYKILNIYTQEKRPPLFQLKWTSVSAYKMVSGETLPSAGQTLILTCFSELGVFFHILL